MAMFDLALDKSILVMAKNRLFAFTTNATIFVILLVWAQAGRANTLVSHAGLAICFDPATAVCPDSSRQSLSAAAFEPARLTAINASEPFGRTEMMW
jgi:hypothetical protein